MANDLFSIMPEQDIIALPSTTVSGPNFIQRVMKPPKASPERIASLVQKAQADIPAKIPVVMRRLYEADPNEPSSSILEELVQNGPKQKNSLLARDDVKALAKGAPRSNILRFECRNAYVGRRDFYNVQPIPRERLYSYKNPLTKGLRFDVVKARNPLNLLFSGAYYLVFPNHLQACIYYMETRSKVMNGFNMKLEFVSPLLNHLKRMGSPLLELGSLHKPLANLNATPEEVFKQSEEKSEILKQLEKVKNFKDSSLLDHHPNYHLLQRFMGIPSRYQLVLVRNLPFGLSSQTLSDLLWDYSFSDRVTPLNSWKEIVKDPITQTHLTLIHFGDEQSAMRFVRNFHGRKWDPISKEREKQLYQPVLCEIVE